MGARKMIKNLSRNAAICTAMLLFSHSSFAAGVWKAQVTQVNVVDVSGTPNVFVKVSGGVPSVACTDKTAYVRPLNDAIGKHLYSAALAAMAMQRQVDILGTDTCGAFSVETMQEIRVYNQ